MKAAEELKVKDVLCPKETELLRIPGETITVRVIEDEQERVWKEFLFRKGDGELATEMAKELEKRGGIKIEKGKQIVVRIRLGLDEITLPLLIRKIVDEIDCFIV